MRIKNVIHEWSAEHLKWVQYPNHSIKNTLAPRNNLPFGARLSFAVIGLFATAIGLLLLLFLVLIVLPAFFA